MRELKRLRTIVREHAGKLQVRVQRWFRTQRQWKVRE